MVYLIAEALGFSLIMIVLGTLSLNKAKKGAAKPWTLYYVSLGLYAFSLLGTIVGGFDGVDLIEYGCVAIVAAIYYWLISNATKQG